VEIVVSRSDWESFLSSLERLMTLHQKTLKRLDDLRVRNEALRAELGTALALPTPKPRNGQETVEFVLQSQLCQYCGREFRAAAKFCDSCGSLIGEMYCQCGRICSSPDRFCDLCGRALAGN
jgi:rRNA maturation endonuclease Nob1